MKITTHCLAVLLALAFAACDNGGDPSCGFIDLTMDGIQYDVNTCEDLNFRSGCEYTIDYLNLCFEEGGQQQCSEVSIAFVSLLAEGEYTIVHPDDFADLAPGGSFITGYIGDLANDGALEPIKYMQSGKLTVTEVDARTGYFTGSFEFQVNMTEEENNMIVASGTFRNVRW